MRHNYKLLAMLLLATTISFAQQVVLLDLGDFGSDTFFASPATYNNVTAEAADADVGSHPIANMINNTGASTGFSFAITSNFQWFGGGNLVSAVPMTGGAAQFEVNAVRDFFFTQNVDEPFEPYGEISFSNLDDSKFYTFEILGSRATTENRESQYTVIGATTEIAFLNAGGPTAEGNISNTVIFPSVQPTGGVIRVGLESGPNNVNKWAYLNCLKMTETDTAASVEDDILANGGLQLFPNPVNDVLNINYILNDSTKSSILIYDITGRLIFDATNGLNQVGTYSYKWNRLNNNGKRVVSGVYFLTLKTDNTSVTKKLILK